MRLPLTQEAPVLPHRHIKTVSNGLIDSLRIIILSFSDKDTCRAVRTLNEIGQVFRILASPRSARMLKTVESRLYTRKQSALNGRSRLSRRNILYGVESVMAGAVCVNSSLYRMRPEPFRARGYFDGSLERISEMILLLGAQLSSFSSKSSLLYEKAFAQALSCERRELYKYRHELLTGGMVEHPANYLTVISDLEGLLVATERLSCSVVETRRRSGG